jgi:predicted PurR-regulated permease PerM
MGLPALWVLLGIMTGGGLGGVPGMLLGVPLLTIGYKLLSRTIQRRLDAKKISV